MGGGVGGQYPSGKATVALKLGGLRCPIGITAGLACQPAVAGGSDEKLQLLVYRSAPPGTPTTHSAAPPAPGTPARRYSATALPFRVKSDGAERV